VIREGPVTVGARCADDSAVTTLDVSAEARAAEGRQALDEIAIAGFVAIGRTYEAAMAHVEFLATTRPRTVAPPVAALPRQVVDEPELASAIVPPAWPAVEVPEPRVSPLVEALQVIEARAEVAAEPAPVLAAAPAASAGPVAEEAPMTGGTRVIVLAQEVEDAPLVELPRQLQGEWVAGRHADAVTDEIPVQAA
jgi:hypothetical protein